MKKTKRMIAMLIASSVASAALVGCSTPKTVDSGASGAAQSGKEATGKKEVVLELFSSKSENGEILKQLIARFEAENPGVKIEFIAPQDAGTVLKTRLAKNDIPDIVAMGGDATYKELQGAGMLEDLGNEPFMANVQEAYLEMVYRLNKDQEKAAYGIPYAANACGVLYNVDMFKEVGLEVPTTWDEFLDVIRKLEAAGKQPFELTFKDSWTGLPMWNAMAADLQPENFTNDRREGKTTFVDTHQEIAEKYLEVLKHAQPDFMGTTYADGNKNFAEGKAAMMLNGNWAIGEFKKVNPSFNVDLFAFPASNDTNKNYVISGVDVLFGVSSATKAKEEAKAFVAFMMQPEIAQEYVNNQFAFSAIKGAEQNDPTVAGIKADVANGKVANFPDHYYPSGFDLAALLSEFGLNVSIGKDEKESIAELLKQCDEKYNTANVN